QLLGIPSVYWIRTQAWCSPPTSGSRVIVPALCTLRPTGSSFRQPRYACQLVLGVATKDPVGERRLTTMRWSRHSQWIEPITGSACRFAKESEAQSAGLG